MTHSRRLLLPLALTLLSVCTGQAAAQGMSDAQIELERERIAAQRADIDAKHGAERAACYQRFAVEDCLRESRQRLRSQNDDLRRQEIVLNETQRKRRGAEQLQRLEEKKSAAPDPVAQKEALEASRAREKRAAAHAESRNAMAADAAQRRQDFEARQRQRAEDASAAAQRRASEPQARERYERKQAEAQRRRALREQSNAERDKPASAPLPVPPQAQ